MVLIQTEPMGEHFSDCMANWLGIPDTYIVILSFFPLRTQRSWKDSQERASADGRQRVGTEEEGKSKGKSKALSLSVHTRLRVTKSCILIWNFNWNSYGMLWKYPLTYLRMLCVPIVLGTPVPTPSV